MGSSLGSGWLLQLKKRHEKRKNVKKHKVEKQV